MFSPAKESGLRDQLDQAERLKQQAGEKIAEAEKLAKSAGASADPAATEKQRAAAAAEGDRLTVQANGIIGSAGKTVDASYAGVEKLVAEWSPQQSLQAVRARRPATAPSTAPTVAAAGGAGAGADAGVPAINLGPLPEADSARPTTRTSLADDDLAQASATPATGDEAQRTMDQAHIDASRLEVAKEPTTAANLDKRLIALTVWSKTLHRQFQRLELVGGDKIDIEYVDEIGPNGPNEPGKAIRRDSLTVASNGQLYVLTPDGKQPIEQAVLGGDIVLRVEDADRDLTKGRTRLPSRWRRSALGNTPHVASPTTAPSTQSSTPGQLAGATTQPLEVAACSSRMALKAWWSR